MSDQFELFDRSAFVPEGLRYCAGFVSAQTEKVLISRIQKLPLQPFQFGQFEGKRRVASFGFRYDYGLRRLQQADPVPAWLTETVSEVETFGGPATRVQQVLCTEYDLGVGIGSHRDKPSTCSSTVNGAPSMRAPRGGAETLSRLIARTTIPARNAACSTATSDERVPSRRWTKRRVRYEITDRVDDQIFIAVISGVPAEWVEINEVGSNWLNCHIKRDFRSA